MRPIVKIDVQDALVVAAGLRDARSVGAFDDAQRRRHLSDARVLFERLVVHQRNERVKGLQRLRDATRERRDRRCDQCDVLFDDDDDDGTG